MLKIALYKIYRNIFSRALVAALDMNRMIQGRIITYNMIKYDTYGYDTIKYSIYYLF